MSTRKSCEKSGVNVKISCPDIDLVKVKVSRRKKLLSESPKVSDNKCSEVSRIILCES